MKPSRAPKGVVDTAAADAAVAGKPTGLPYRALHYMIAGDTLELVEPRLTLKHS